MNEQTLTKICLAITVAGIIALLITYQPEFEKSSTTQMLAKEGSKGILYGRVEYVVENYPVTVFTLNDGNRAMLYYPRPMLLETNDFVTVYAENQPETFEGQNGAANAGVKKSGAAKTLFAHKVVKE